MVKEVLDFVAYIKAKQGFYLVEDNLERALSFSEKAFNFIARDTKEVFLNKWNKEIIDEDFKWEWIGGLQLDWQVTIENIYLYGGFKNSGFSSALVSPAQPDYKTVECEHDFFTEEEKRFLKEETNWFSGSAHGMGNATFGIFHRTKEKYPFDILFLDRGRIFKTSFTLESYYQAMIESMAVCGWQYFYLDFEEIQNACGDYKVEHGWLTLYPYLEGMAASPLGHDVKKDTLRIDALLHHMEVCVYLLPKIFSDKDFSYHRQRLADFKKYLNK